MNYQIKSFIAAKEFLIRELERADAAEIIESYLVPPEQSSVPVSLNKLFLNLLGSAQNANMKASVIGGAIGGVEKLGIALFEFDTKKVEELFSNDPNRLLKHIIDTLQPRGQIRTTTRSIWPKYCQTILSGATFLNQFKDGQEFYEWAHHLYDDPRTMAALPMIIAAEIEGIGYPLACDFLKELGFINYGKPDVHIIEIFAGIGLCTENANPYNIQKTISQIAKVTEMSAYAVDKLFWLIGSGKFYNHPNLGKSGQIGKLKAKFISEFNYLEKEGPNVKAQLPIVN